MFLIVICMALIVFMPLIAKIPLAVMMVKSGGYNNKYPRAQQNQLEGLGARAAAAHKNCYEATCYFAPTVLTVLALDEHNVYTAALCIAFVITRLLYLICYWANWHIVRSIIWLLSMLLLLPHYWMLLN